MAPVAITTASYSSTSLSAPRSAPTVTPVTNRTPSASSRATRRSTTSLSSFMFGMPYISSPPIRSARSKTVTRWPARLSWSAAARPAGPLPITATVNPVRASGGLGVIQPSSQARSAISSSMVLIVTGSPSMPTVHEPSHGAGQTRPVNSGKLFVKWRRMLASCHWPR